MFFYVIGIIKCLLSGIISKFMIGIMAIPRKLVLTMFIFHVLDEVGSFELVGHVRFSRVKVGHDAEIKWNYILAQDEKMEQIYVGYYNKKKERKYLALKRNNRTILYTAESNQGRYKEDELNIFIDDTSKVTLTLKTVQKSTDNDVDYFVSYTYSKGGNEISKMSTTTIIVIETPKLIGKAPSLKNVEENKDVSLPCKAAGKPPPEIRWYKQGSPNVIAEGNETRSLKLKNLKRLQGGNFTCVATNIAGNDSYTVSVVVQYKPTINYTASTNRIGTYLYNPKPIYLVCVADGEPPPIYKWNNPMTHQITGIKGISEGRVAIMLPTQEKIGYYMCEASNLVGFDRHRIEVFSIDKPAKVKIDVKVEQRSAVIMMDIPSDPGKGSIKEVILSYLGNGKLIKETVTHYKNPLKLDNLIPYTKYELNVTVANEYFTSEGQKETFQTKEDKPGPPSYVNLLSLSPYTMKVSWKAPVEKNGKITQYILQFSKVDEKIPTNYTLDPSKTHWNADNLLPYTLYKVSLVAATTIGFGPWVKNKTNRTQPEAPGAPVNITVSHVIHFSHLPGTLAVSWFPPASGNAPLTEYEINITCTLKETGQKRFRLVTDKVPKQVGQRLKEVPNIHPYSTCEVMIREGAGPSPQWGEYSPPQPIVIPESAPEKPKELRSVSASHDYILLFWKRPDRINGVLKKYVIQYKNKSGTYEEELLTELSNKTFYFKLRYLRSMTNYTIKVVAHTEYYDTQSLSLDIGTDYRPTPALAPIRKEEGNAGPVIGGVLTVLFILVLAAGILLYIVRKKKRVDRANSSNSDVGFFQKGDHGNIYLVDGPLNSPVPKSAFMSDYVKNAQCTFTPKNPIPITSLKDYVKKYHISKAKGFIDEFRSIKCERVGSLDISSRAENKCKNRYANILAYDHSRVVLNTVEDLEGSDYVNANYIDGYNKKAKFIATQGPVVAAFNDFWRMIWEQDAHKIIMVTNLVEKSRIKCQKYWPCESEKGVLYGNIKVQMIDEIQLAEYVVRRFSITQVKDGTEIASRTVTQYQFLSWPDHGVPQYPTALLQFVKRVRSLDQGTTGPIVCHCSAGVGRTGTYITLDAMLDQIENEKTVDVLGYVTHIRGQRQLMVQTEAQYIYIYDTLLEAVSCGNTEVTTVDLFTRIKHLDSINPGTTRTYMQEEFERVSFNMDDTNQYEAAVLPCNLPKNRYPEVLPYELTRVKLWPYANIEGSDYINASFIDGYQQREAYVLTQSPLENTVEEFWRMLWEYEVFTIIMISSPSERSKHHCYPYWPLTNEPTLFGILAVQLAAEEEKVDFIRREFRVTNSKNGESRTISHFMYFDWPIEGSPDTASAIEMIGQVQKTQQQTGNNAIVVHCSDGSGRSGSLAALMYCLERLKLEGLVDVFQTVRQMRTQRIGLVQSLEQYHFIYMAVSNFLDCFSNYANFK